MLSKEELKIKEQLIADLIFAMDNQYRLRPMVNGFLSSDRMEFVKELREWEQLTTELEIEYEAWGFEWK